MKSTLKPALRWVHRWIGVTLGVLLVVISVSGSLLILQPQFFRWAHGDLIPAGLSQQRGSIDAWVRNARAAAPGLQGPIAIWQPHVSHNVSDAGMVVFSGGKGGGFGNSGFVAVLIAPATGEALGVVDVDRSAAYAPLFLHGSLWAGSAGRLLLGIMAVGALLMLGIGIYLWWPPRQRLLQKLSPRPWRNTFLYAGRLHDWSGAWAVVFLLVLAGTGVYMVQPAWVEPALSALPDAPAAGMPHGTAEACPGSMGFDEAIRKAQPLVPSGTLTTLAPGHAPQHWELIFAAKSSESGLRATHVAADLQCGTVAVESTSEARAPRESAEMWLSGLHDGTAFGLGGELFVTLIGIVPLVLLWSGLRTWLRRSRRGA